MKHGYHNLTVFHIFIYTWIKTLLPINVSFYECSIFFTVTNHAIAKNFILLRNANYRLNHSYIYIIYVHIRVKKILYNRKTIAFWNYWINQMSCIIQLFFYATQITNTFLNSRISGNYDKMGRLSANANGEILIKGIVFFIVESLFTYYINRVSQ